MTAGLGRLIQQANRQSQDGVRNSPSETQVRLRLRDYCESSQDRKTSGPGRRNPKKSVRVKPGTIQSLSVWTMGDRLPGPCGALAAAMRERGRERRGERV